MSETNETQKRIDLIVQTCMNQNAKFLAQIQAPVEISGRQKKLRDAIYDGGFGWNTESVKKLVEAITDVQIPSKDNSKVDLLPMMAFYRGEGGRVSQTVKGKLRIVLSVSPKTGYRALSENGCEVLHCCPVDEVILCTEEELRKFLDSLSLNSNMLECYFSQLFLAVGL